MTVPPVLIVALQTGAAANGGIASLGSILGSLTRYRPIVLTDRESATTERWRAAGMEIHIVPETASLGWGRRPGGAIASYWRYFFAVRRLLARSGARVVHANDPLAFQLAYPAVRTVPGVRILLNLRDTLDTERKPPRGKYQFLFRRADGTLFLSHDMVERWSEVAPAARTKAAVTYSIVDFDRFPIRPLPTERPKMVLLSGVVWPKKGQLEYLRHLAPALAGSGIQSWLAGDFDPARSDYAAQCQAAAAPLGEMVQFLGYRDDLPALIERAHAICIVSRHEGLMRAMLEAMAMGRPVVSTDVASAREMLEVAGRRAGAVFAFGSHADMAAELIRMCEDEDANRELGSNGAALARERLTRERVVAAYEASYDKAISAPKNPA